MREEQRSGESGARQRAAEVTKPGPGHSLATPPDRGAGDAGAGPSSRPAHTPGPWRVERGALGTVFVYSGPVGVGAVLSDPPVQPRERVLVATINVLVQDAEEAVATGELIAAAPQMAADLAALREALADTSNVLESCGRWIARHDGRGDDHPFVVRCKESLTAARAALARCKAVRS